MIKAASGGGGKGIRIVNSDKELEKVFDVVRQEAKISFNDDSVYIEKFINSKDSRSQNELQEIEKNKNEILLEKNKEKKK